MGRGTRDHRQDQERAHLGNTPHTLTARPAKRRRRPGDSRKGWLRSAIPALAAVAILAFGYYQGWLGAGGDRPIDLAPGQTLSAEVTRVVDGDTVIVEVDGHEERLRYIGIDTPESVTPDRPVECFGPEASDYNSRMVDGRTIELVIGSEPRDHYDRLLGYVFVGELFVNAELVRAGYAETLTIPPNDRHADAFSRLQRRAVQAGIGMWSACP